MSDCHHNRILSNFVPNSIDKDVHGFDWTCAFQGDNKKQFFPLNVYAENSKKIIEKKIEHWLRGEWYSMRIDVTI